MPIVSLLASIFGFLTLSLVGVGAFLVLQLASIIALWVWTLLHDKKKRLTIGKLAWSVMSGLLVGLAVYLPSQLLSESPRSRRYVSDSTERRRSYPDSSGRRAVPSYEMRQDFSETLDISQAEMKAIARMKAIAESQRTYSRFVTGGTYGSLAELRAKGLIDHADRQDGYTFAVTTESGSFEAYAFPNNYGFTGKNSFYVTRDGVVRGGDKQGGIADRDAPRLR